MRPEDTAGFGPVGTNATAPQPLTAARLAEIRGRVDEDQRRGWAKVCACSACWNDRIKDRAALLADNERLRAALALWGRFVVTTSEDDMRLAVDATVAALGEGEDSHG